jgi:hypothetical protein
MARPPAIAIAILVAATVVIGAGRARADNGFPSSLQILLPADQPQRIALATNFGLLISEDGGTSWQWTCEQMGTLGATIYAIGPSPQDRTFALSAQGLAYSDDGTCTWTTSHGTLDQAVVNDFFPDATDATRVLAVAQMQSGTDIVTELFPSGDGGATFGATIFTVSDTTAMPTGLEIARSDPRTIYMAYYTTTQVPMGGQSVTVTHPKLSRSTDGGGSFTTIDLEPMLGQVQVRIMAVDPADPMTIYLRVMDAVQNQESAAVSRDGGATLAMPVVVPGGVLTGFARLASGTVLVTATANTVPQGFRSHDGAMTFQDWPGVPHIQALAERAGKLYVGAKNYTDGYALGVSSDEGLTITPIATYDQVTAIKACAQTVCEDSCSYEAGLKVWDPMVCCANGVGADACMTATPPAKSGCGCAVGSGSGRGGPAAAALALSGAALLLAAVARRRGRARRGLRARRR